MKVHGVVFMPDSKIIIVADRPEAGEGEEVKLTILSDKELAEIEAKAEQRGLEKRYGVAPLPQQ